MKIHHIEASGMVAEAELRETFIAFKAYIKKEEVYNQWPKVHLKKLENEEQSNTKIIRREGIMNIRAKLNKI